MARLKLQNIIPALISCGKKVLMKKNMWKKFAGNDGLFIRKYAKFELLVSETKFKVSNIVVDANQGMKPSVKVSITVVSQASDFWSQLNKALIFTGGFLHVSFCHCLVLSRLQYHVFI